MRSCRGSKAWAYVPHRGSVVAYVPHRGSVVGGCPVPGEHVEAEVGTGVSPHGVRMIRAPLSVVPLDEQPWTLQPVVVRCAGHRRASPGDVDGVEHAIVVV